MAKTIQNFFDLQAWQNARALAKLTYQKSEQFPKSEIFGLSNQMRRAAVSVAANIAEGFGRISIKEKIHFYNQSAASLTELQSHCLIASDLTYVPKDSLAALSEQIYSTQKLIAGLIRSTKKRLS